MTAPRDRAPWPRAWAVATAALATACDAELDQRLAIIDHSRVLA